MSREDSNPPPVPKRKQLSVPGSITEYALGDIKLPVRKNNLSLPARRPVRRHDDPFEKSTQSLPCDDLDEPSQRAGSRRSYNFGQSLQTDIAEGDEDSPSPPPLPPRGNLPSLQPKTVFGTDTITRLDANTFNAFISGKEKILVIFYELRTPEFEKLATQFGFTAASSQNKRHAFAAVDCRLDKQLCCHEKVINSCRTPSLKLFSNGYEVSTIQDASKFTNIEMKMLVEMTPVLNQPRGAKQV